ncbi:MAG: hypothetical protein K9L85_01720 [Candidatus Peribacteraceae bacterium]|nr:hypothetical protein [Candidatus Peribacteraceae bacterium]
MTDQNQNSNQAGQTGFTPLPDEQKKTGVPLAQVATAQIAITRADIEKFGIDEEFVKKNPALIDLILKTESMKDEERKYWFQLLPVMTGDQVEKLQNILQNERDQLAELDAKYENEISRLNANAPAWDREKFQARRKATEEAEKAAESKEQDDEDQILNQLKNL